MSLSSHHAAGAARTARAYEARIVRHDGAQQRLVALSLTLRLAENRLAAGDPHAPELLRRAKAELAEALEELRELARGIHPSILIDRGLVPALEMLAGRASIPVELSVTLDHRLPRAARRRRLLHRRRGADKRLQARPRVARACARQRRRPPPRLGRARPR